MAGCYRSPEDRHLNCTLVVRARFCSRAGQEEVGSDLFLLHPSAGLELSPIFARREVQGKRTGTPSAVTMTRSFPPGVPTNAQIRGHGLLPVRAWPQGPGPIQRCSRWKEGALGGRSDLGGALSQPRFISPQSRTGPQNCPWLSRVEEGKLRSGLPLPDYAPLWLDPHDGGVLHILEEQVLVDAGLVHLHHHLHF